LADEPEIYIYHRVQLKELKETILFVVMPAVDGETSRLELESFLPELVHIIFVVLRVISVMHTVIDQIDGIKVKIFFSETILPQASPSKLTYPSPRKEIQISTAIIQNTSNRVDSPFCSAWFTFYIQDLSIR
jgi:hypothetical protein